ncbi:microtubule motor protein [Aureococcus anophagefferens]|uniref:Microtubule motor protein n=1 Tax=Aureococcus anophagefferens TaxID=44056 RepID=A0ABR1FPY5_AURAN
MSDKELQRALLKERRAAEKCERLKVQCRSQAALMTRLFASKLGEQGELLSEALDRGASAELAGRAAAFRESTAWILGEIEAGGIEGASDAELDALRAENAALVDARDELERRYVEGGTTLTAPEPSHAEQRIRDLEDELDAADHKEALKKAKAKARAADGDAVKNAEKEKEQLMSAMEKEVEALIAEERAKFDKERERLEKSAAKAKKSAKGNTKALSALAKQLPAVSKDVAAQILSRVRSTERELAETTRKYKRELGERKRLHNLVQELRGNIRVFCRVRPVSKREREHAGEDMASRAAAEKTFEYDQVFNVDSKQADVYEEISGLDLFAKAADRRGDTDDKIKVSVIEVYNEQIRDLLSDKVGAKKLEVRRGDRGNYVPDLTEVDVRGDDEALKEAQNINKSLARSATSSRRARAGSAHIPFRNSTLTHLLQDSLSQDSKTLMFCCISPILYNVDETFCTLTFASRVGSVELGKATKRVVGGAAPGKKPQRKSIA